MRRVIILILLPCCLLGCTETQWQASKEAMALVVLGTLTQPVTTTQCRTVVAGNTVKSVCSTY